MNEHAIREYLKTIDNGGKTVVDYIVEQGTSGIWTYRKWNSGIAECWGTSTFSNVPLTTVWGSCYYSSSVGRTISLPSSLFISVSSVACTVDSHGGLVCFTLDSRSTSDINGYLWSSMSETRSSLDVFASVKGRWK